MGWFNRGKKEMVTKTAAAGVKTARDPVCGMDVETDRAAATSTYQGQTYYFCAPGCKKSFDSDPEKYLKGGSHSGGGCC